jgi:Ni,Fe-hydrogenase I cytochrome b subunit
MQNFKRVASLIAIALLSLLVIALGIEAFYKSPKYDDFCKFDRAEPYLAEKPGLCDYKQTKDEYECSINKGMPRYDFNDKGCRFYKECDFCNKNFEEANKPYSRTVFIVHVIAGVILILIGMYIKFDFVGTGFIYGGILNLLTGVIRYFSEMSPILRFITVLIALIIVVWVAIKKLGK